MREENGNPHFGILHHEENVDLLPANLELSAMEMMLVTTMSRETVLRGCFWCKEQIDEFGDRRVTASEITVVSRDRFGKRKLPRNFCPVCGRQLEEELKDETETL